MKLLSSTWPNFYIVGAAKCGTTSLYAQLKKHPHVFLPEIKEPNFFAAGPGPGEIPMNVPRCADRSAYQQLYKAAGGYRAVGDASPSYLWDPEATRRIHEVCPQAKIVIMLRDPVARAQSHYLDNVLHRIESEPTFQEALQRDIAEVGLSWFASPHYVEVGKYYEQVRRYLDTFGSDHVLVLLFDDLAKTPGRLFSQIASHIGIDAARFETIENAQVHNLYRMPRFKTAYWLAGRLGLRTKLLPPSVRRWLNRNPLLFDRKKPAVEDESRRYLQEIYSPDIIRLEELLGRKLPELRKSWL